MSVSLDITTQTGQVRYLIGDTDLVNANYTDEEIAGFLSLAGSLYLACALALDGLASGICLNFANIVAGSLKIDDTNQVDALREMSDRFRTLDNSLPAWAVAEENLSGSNELLIIRNFILRTEV